MKFRKFLLLLLVVFFTLNSCQYILDEEYKKEIQEMYTSPYMGIWLVHYTGGTENGTFTLKVAKNGYVSGSYGQNQELIAGAVLDDGALLSVKSVSSGFQIYGNLNTKNGTWKLNEYSSGTWTAVKQ